MQTTLRASYSNHYRKGLIRLLEVLEFHCDNSHRPVLDALALVHRYRGSTGLTYFPAGETVPIYVGLSGNWTELAYRTDKADARRVVRTVYEIRTFDALIAQLKCKGIWVVGARDFRNPDEDLPQDFGERRTEHYQALRKPLDAGAFIADLQRELHAVLSEPRNLGRLKRVIIDRWGTFR